MSVKDNSERYGKVSRILHWGMALLLLWQFLSAGSHLLLEDTAVEAFLFSTHKPLGFLLFLLIIVRIVWALANLSSRPPSINAAARWGHVGLYVLMLVVPALALLRQYGSGRSFEPFGLPLFPGFDADKIAWMVTPGNLLHSWLGWALLAMIVGHVVMAIRHRKNPAHTDVMPRMWR
jgi:cytochrome b561